MGAYGVRGASSDSSYSWCSGKESTCYMQEIWVQFLGQKDPQEKEITTHFNILAWEISWTEDAIRQEKEIKSIKLRKRERKLYLLAGTIIIYIKIQRLKKKPKTTKKTNK